jgi:hypothetical protein
VVNLYSGWIVQLVNASFAWHTHLDILLKEFQKLWIPKDFNRFPSDSIFNLFFLASAKK